MKPQFYDLHGKREPVVEVTFPSFGYFSLDSYAFFSVAKSLMLKIYLAVASKLGFISINLFFAFLVKLYFVSCDLLEPVIILV